MITHIQRIEACLAGEPLDRPPVALWRHFPVDDQSPDTLAAAILSFQRTYDFDLVKVTPASSFCLKDWGVEDRWQGDTEGTRTYTKRAIIKPEEWGKLRVLDPTAPHLAAQLDCLRQIKRELPDTPVLQTIFNPLAQAKNLVGGENMLAHMRQYPESLAKGLAVITETTRRFIIECIAAGADGIFYAVQHAQAHLLSADEFLRFSKPDDVTLLGAAKKLRFNMLHLHGKNILFEQVTDYPVQVTNWHDRESQWSLSDGQKNFKSIVCGGIRQETIVYGTPVQVRAEAEDAIALTRGKRFILGTGCVVPIIASHANLRTTRESVEKK
jgi:uroporphyrinogen decarboxylase